MFRRQILTVLAVGVILGCGRTSDSPTETQVTSVTFVNKGPVTASASSTKVIINKDSVEYSISQTDQVVEKWVRRLNIADFIPMQNEASALFKAPDVTLQSGQPSCAGWNGMTVIIEKAGATHSVEISGAACDRAKWPDGVRKLLDFHDVLVVTIVCPTFTPPAPDWCADGTILSPIIDANGCEGPPRCQRNESACPEWSPPSPDWCSDGTVISPAKDENGCYGPPSCQRNE